MKLSLYPYQLQFKFPFHLAHGVRTHTDVVYVKLEHENFIAWGEAALPPYLSETQKSVIDFLTGFSKNVSSNSIDYWFEQLNEVETNTSAKAALDMALWSLKAQLENKTVGELLAKTFQLPDSTLYEQNLSCLQCTYTIGVSSFNEMKLKVEDAGKYGFEIFKLKLNGENDEEVVRNFQKLSDKKFCVDVNQGWKSLEEAIAKISFLSDEGCLLVEQPLPKEKNEEMELLKEKSPLPLFADESCQRLNDIEKIKNSFHGINIKLMKCGGINEAYQMIKKGRELNLKILIGCMSESSVGCTAAAHLTPFANYADLDGPNLITNDPFTGIKVVNGRMKIFPLKQSMGNIF